MRGIEEEIDRKDIWSRSERNQERRWKDAQARAKKEIDIDALVRFGEKKRQEKEAAAAAKKQEDEAAAALKKRRRSLEKAHAPIMRNKYMESFVKESGGDRSKNS